MRLTIGIGLISLLLLFGCKSKKNAVVVEDAKQEVDTMEDSKSNFEKLAGSYRITFVKDFPEMENLSPTLTIKKDGTVGGNNGCNSFFGKLNGDGGRVFSHMGATRMACQGIAQELERTINQAFELGDNLQQEGQELILYFAEEVVLKAKMISLEGEWKVVKLGDKEIKEPIVFFSVSNSNIAGTTGCNTFNASFQEDGYILKLNDVYATEMDCEGFDTVDEAIFLRGLEQVTSYKQNKNIAVFYFGVKPMFTAVTIQEEE